jgi:hypothetical protein
MRVDMNATTTREVSARDTTPRPRLALPVDHQRVLLVLSSGEEAPRLLEFGARASLTLGRAEPADVCITDPGVSRLHARFAREIAGVRVTDLGSRNGTWVRGLRVSDALLSAGDSVAIGSTTLLVQIASARGQLAPSSSAAPQAVERGDSAPEHSQELAIGANFNLRESLREHETKLIREALRRTQGNQRRAAELLELPLRTFERKLRSITLRQRHASS